MKQFSEHPQVQEQLLRVRAAEQKELLAQKAKQPVVTLGAEYMNIGRGENQLAGTDAFMPMVQLRLPLNRSQYAAAGKEAQLLQEQYQLQAEAATADLERQLSDAVFMYRQQRQLLSLNQKQRETAEQTIELLLASYANNNTDLEKILLVQEQLLKYYKGCCYCRGAGAAGG